MNEPIKSWPVEERPREILLREGAAGLRLSSLLAIILGSGVPGASAERLGRTLLARYRGLRAMDTAGPRELAGVRGIGAAKAARIAAALELGKRLMREEVSRSPAIAGAEEAVAYVHAYYGPYLRDAPKEHFCLLVLNRKNRPLAALELTRGTATASLVDPGEVVREAVMRRAVSVLLVHNHPSGEGEPSAEDIAVTARVAEACRIVGVELLDHVIVGSNRDDHFSFRRAGLLPVQG